MEQALAGGSHRCMEQALAGGSHRHLWGVAPERRRNTGWRWRLMFGVVVWFDLATSTCFVGTPLAPSATHRFKTIAWTIAWSARSREARAGIPIESKDRLAVG